MALRGPRGIKRPHPLGSLPSRSGVSLLTAESGIETSGLPGVKISGLPAAGAATVADQLEVNQGGTSRRLTLDQALALVDVPAGDWDSITGKPSTFPPSSHTHPSTEITDFAEATDDRVAAFLVAGSNVTLTHNDAANSLTIASTGGGGGAPSGPAGGDLAGTYPNPTVNPEAIDDRVAALLVAGANVTLSYNDAAGSLTIASTAAGGGGGTVTSTSVVSANGLAGTVATPTTTPAITLTTSVNGMVKGNGTALSAATAGTDYMTPGNVSAAYQPLDSGLTALAGIGTGMIANTATDAFSPRTITGTASRVTVSNGNGVSGNPTLDISATYDALWQPVDADLTALAALTTTGMMARSAANTYTMRTITGTTNRLTVSNGDGIAGNPTLDISATYDALWQPKDTDLSALAGLDATAGLVEQTGAAAFTKRALGVGASTSVPTRADADTRYLPVVSTTAPGSPVDNQLWFYNDDAIGGGQLFLRYNDGAGASQWVPASPGVGSGAVVQTVFFETGAVATGTTAIPSDDTIPQIAEGDQYMTLAITPTSATSKLIINVVVHLGHTVAPNAMTAALFQDATANALAASAFFLGHSGVPSNVSFRHVMTSGTTSATTFRVRAGGNSPGTATFNGYGSGRIYGGVMASSIVIQEVL